MPATLKQLIFERRCRIKFWQRQPDSEWRRHFLAGARSEIWVWRKLFSTTDGHR